MIGCGTTKGPKNAFEIEIFWQPHPQKNAFKEWIKRNMQEFQVGGFPQVGVKMKNDLETTTQFKFANSSNYKRCKTFIPSSPSKIKIFAPLSKWSNLHQAMPCFLKSNPEIPPFCPRCLPYWLTWTPSTLPAFEIVSKQFFGTKNTEWFFPNQFGKTVFLLKWWKQTVCFCWWTLISLLGCWELAPPLNLLDISCLSTIYPKAAGRCTKQCAYARRGEARNPKQLRGTFVSDQTPNRSSKSNHKVPTIRFFNPQSSNKNIWMFSSASFFLEANGSERHERHERTNQPKKDLEKTAPTQIFVRRNHSTLAVLQRCFSSWIFHCLPNILVNSPCLPINKPTTFSSGCASFLIFPRYLTGCPQFRGFEKNMSIRESILENSAEIKIKYIFDIYKNR